MREREKKEREKREDERRRKIDKGEAVMMKLKRGIGKSVLISPADESPP